MDKDAILKHIQQYIFRENNGKIMRIVNILNPRESTVGNICELLHGEPQEDIQRSLNYLIEAGYIRIKGANGEAFTGELEDSMKSHRISLTAAGMDILMGIKENPSVDA